MATMSDEKKKSNLLAWLIVILVPLALYAIPANSLYTNNIRLFFVITSCAILLLAFELIPYFLTGVLLPGVYFLVEIAPAAVIFQPWSTMLPWLMMASFLIVNILMRIGLLNRAAYWIVLKTGASYHGTIYGFLIIGFLFSLFIPGIVYLIIIPLAYAICKTLKLEDSKVGTGIMLAALIGTIMPAMIIYNPGLSGLAFSILENNFGITVSWWKILFDNAIFIPMCFVTMFVLSKMFKQDIPFQGKAYFEAQLQQCGEMSTAEKKTIFLLLLLGIGIMTNIMSLGWLFVIIATCFYLPGFAIGHDEDIAKINMSIVMFIASCMTIGQVAGAIGVGDLLAGMMTPILQACDNSAFIMLVWLCAVLVNLVLTPLAAIATLVVPITQTALNMGINPLPGLYAFLQGLDQLILPYESSYYLFLFSFGIVKMKDFVKFCSVKMLICIFYIVAIAVPYWYLIGLF